MPVTMPISSELIDRSITQALGLVFDTMIKTPITLLSCSDQIEPEQLPEGTQVMGCVGFVGRINGIIHLRFGEDFAVAATGRVLDMPPAQVRAEGREVVKDTIGEITNMSVGGFKNCFCDLGFPCKLTLPTIAWGERLNTPRIKDATRRVYVFENLGFRLLADLQMKEE